MLTAADVEQKTFSTALRGYDLDEVDDFLDEVVATLKELNEKLEEAQTAQVVAPSAAPEPVEEVSKPEPEPDSSSEPEPEPPSAPGPALDESAVGRALIAAQTAADKLLEDAETQASHILEDARQQADTWESEKQAKKAEALAEMASLADRVRSVRSELAVLAEQVSGNLDEMDSVIASSGVDEGDLAEDGGDVNQVTVLDTDGAGESEGDAETSADDTDTADGADHLDQILTGVATDLQLGESGDDGDEEDDEHDEADEDEAADEDEGADEDEERD